MLSVWPIQLSLKGNTIFIFALLASASIIPWQSLPCQETSTVTDVQVKGFHLPSNALCDDMWFSAHLALCHSSRCVISCFGFSCVPYCLFAVSLLSPLQKAANAHFRGGSPACQRRRSRVIAMLSCVSWEQIFTEAVWMGENTVLGGEAAGVVTKPNTDETQKRRLKRGTPTEGEHIIIFTSLKGDLSRISLFSVIHWNSITMMNVYIKGPVCRIKWDILAESKYNTISMSLLVYYWLWIGPFVCSHCQQLVVSSPSAVRVSENHSTALISVFNPC